MHSTGTMHLDGVWVLALAGGLEIGVACGGQAFYSGGDFTIEVITHTQSGWLVVENR